MADGHESLLLAGAAGAGRGRPRGKSAPGRMERVVPADNDHRDEEVECFLAGKLVLPEDPFITPARPPRHRIDHYFDVWKSMRKRETWEQAEIRAMKRTIANLHRRVRLMEDMAGRPGPSPVHGERDTASEQAIRNSLAGHLTQRIDSAITGIYRHLDRRDAHIVFQLQHQGTRISVAEYRITNLAGNVSNLIQQAGGYFADVWRTTGGVE